MNAGLVARLVVLLLALSEAFLVKSTALPWSVCDAATLQPKHVAGMECTARNMKTRSQQTRHRYCSFSRHSRRGLGI